MTAQYLYDWGVETFLPIQDKDFKKIAIKFWTRKLLEVSEMKLGDFIAQHFFVAPSGVITESFKRWYREGYPDPKFILDDGAPGRPLTFGAKYPGTLNVLLHPGWVMLAGPTTIKSCRLLLNKLNDPVASFISQRFKSEAPGFNTIPRTLLMDLLGDFYTDSYVRCLKKNGSFDAFIAVLGLSIEKFLHEAEDYSAVPVFHFDPKEWFFCHSLKAAELATLVERIKALNKAYKEPVIAPTETDAKKILRAHLKSDVDSEQLKRLESLLKKSLRKRTRSRLSNKDWSAV